MHYVSRELGGGVQDTVTAIHIKWPSFYLSYINKIDNSSQMLAFSLMRCLNFMYQDLERSKYSVFTRQWHTFENVLIN